MEILLFIVCGYFFFKLGGLRHIALYINKVSARIIVQELLHEQYVRLTFSNDPAKSARRFVAFVWHYNSRYFRSRTYGTPHVRIIVVYTLAVVAQKLVEKNSRDLDGVLIAFLNATENLEGDMQGYVFKEIDGSLLREAWAIAEPLLDKIVNSPISQDVNRILDLDNPIIKR